MVNSVVLNGLAFQGRVEDLHDDPPVSDKDRGKPIVDELLTLPTHRHLYESTVRHLQPPILQSDENLCDLWRLRWSGSVIEYCEALRSRVRDGP